MRTTVVPAICLVWLPLALSSACKSTPGIELGTFTCKDVQKDTCIGPTDRFETTVPVIHMTHTTEDLPKNGDVYTIEWIAEDVGAAAPANSVIDSIERKVTDVVDGTASYTVNSHVTKPTSGWPKGSYRIDVKLGGKVATTARFKVE